MKRPVLSAAAIVLAAGCAATAATSEPPVQPQRPPIGCIGLDVAGCTAVADAALARLGDARAAVTYLQVGPFSCREEGCPPGLATRPTGDVTVELRGREPTVFGVDASGGSIALAVRGDAFLLAVQPASRRLAGAAAPFQLAHCGIFSGIDIDGTFWDPVGIVDGDHADAINAAEATFTMTSPVTATLRTRGGLSLDLIRHEGPKYLPGCM